MQEIIERVNYTLLEEGGRGFEDLTKEKTKEERKERRKERANEGTKEQRSNE